MLLERDEDKQAGRFQKHFVKYRVLLLIAITLLSLLAIGLVRLYDPQSPTLLFLDMGPMQFQQNVSSSQSLMRGKVASLGWIVGKDCQRGLQAYLKTANTNPDAALVGTGWVDPTNGHLINGQSNNCMSGSLSMDNVVQLVHSKGGMAYLTVTMETDGTSGSWTSQQQSDYIAKALKLRPIRAISTRLSARLSVQITMVLLWIWKGPILLILLSSNSSPHTTSTYGLR